MIYHAFQVKMSAMNKPENSRKRKQFSIKDKIDIIDQVKNGKSRSAVTKEFSVPEATLRGWLKDEDRLRSSLSEMDILHRAKAEARESCRQTMLTDFFFRN